MLVVLFLKCPDYKMSIPDIFSSMEMATRKRDICQIKKQHQTLSTENAPSG